MKKKIAELKEKRAKILQDQRSLYEQADKEERGLTAEEQESYARMDTEFDDLTRQIRELEADLERRDRLKTREDLLNSYQRPDLSDLDPETRTEEALREYRAAYTKLLRYGKDTLEREELRALQVGTDSEGGYLVPEEFEKKLVAVLEEENILRSKCTKITTAGDRVIPVESSNGAASWTAEEAAYNQSDNEFGQVSLSAYKLTRIIKVSEELLQDSFFDLGGYLATAFGRSFGLAEETAFMTGDGTGKPTGLMAASGGSATGVTAEEPDSIESDEIIDLYHSLKRTYRRKAEFYMHDSTVKVLRKLKNTTTGDYMWQPGLRAGEPDMLLGRPVNTCDAVDVIGASAKVILFADLSYYWIADRKGRVFQRLNELYAANGQVGFKGYQRLDAKLVDSNAARHLAMAAA